MKISKAILVTSLAILPLLANAGDNRNKEEITNKLTFLYSCPAEDYEFQCLKKQGMMKKNCVEFGVSGCGNKFIYTMMGKTWILTSSNLANLGGEKNTAAMLHSENQSVVMNQANIASQQAATMAANQAAMAASQAAMAANHAAMAATPPPQ